MRKIILLLILTSCISNLNSQFQLEAEYSTSSLSRYVLQDQTEIYSFVDASNQQVRIFNEDHLLIDSIPLGPCLNYSSALVRTDFSFGMGVYYQCTDENGITEYKVVDKEGNLQASFGRRAILTTDYIIDYDDITNSTSIYNTQDLSLVANFDDLRIRNARNSFNSEVNFVAHNGTDSLFLYDASFNRILAIEADLDGNILSTVLVGSTLINGELEYFFVVRTSNFNFENFSKVFAEDGTELYSVEGRVSMHKHDGFLQAVHIVSQGQINTYDFTTNEINTIDFQGISGATDQFFSGKYLCFKIDTENQELLLYNTNREIAQTIVFDDPNYSFGLRNFTDQLDREYIYYTRNGTMGNESILMNIEGEILNVFENTFFLGVSRPTGRATKLIATPEDNLSAVYAIDETSSLYSDNIDSAASIYPNPSSDLINLNASYTITSADIYDLNGKLILTRKDQNLNQVNISTLHSGIYTIILKDSKGVSTTKKLIKL